MKYSINNLSLEQINSLAQFIAQKIIKPSLICLIGDLGTGKTTFTKALTKGIGINKTAKSPSFTLINRYEDNGKVIYHIDLYRLDKPDEIFLWDLEEYLITPNSITVIEWADRLELLNDYENLTIHFDYSDCSNRRNLILETEYNNYIELLNEVKELVNTWT